MISKMSIFLVLGVIFFLNLQARVSAEKDKLKLCLVDGKKTGKLFHSTCPNLVKTKSKVECIFASDRISCLKLLIDDQVDFMTAEPEDLILIGITDAHNNKIIVTHELRVWENERSSSQFVTVIRQSVHDVWHTAKKRFCSPGLSVLDYLEYFENQLVIPDCSSKRSLLENRLSALSQYFESACIGGPWTSDHHFDNHLKKKYQNLCSQCGSSSCSVEDRYFGKEGVLMCLTDGGGEIAWSRLDYVHRHFKELHDDENEYYFLCTDGTLKNLTDSDPCTWFDVPWRTVIARKDVAEEVKKLINYETNGTNEVTNFLSLLQEDIRRVPVNIDFRTPNEYLKTSFPKFYSFKDHLQCKLNNREVRWCVSSNLEAQKCEWISKSANSYGLEPLIKCTRESSRESCMKSVENKKSDIFAVEPIEEPEAIKKGLKPIVRLVSDSVTHGNEIAAIVNKFTDINSLGDLRNHKACFTNFRDAGWNTFVYMMRNLTGDNDWYCKDKEMVSQFFRESCVIDLNERNTSFPKNLYSFCSHETEKGVDKAAFECLNTGGGDVAFVNWSSLSKSISSSSKNIYRPLCINSSKFGSGKTEKCYSSWTNRGSLMIHERIPQMREDELYLLLMDLNRLFGENYEGLTPLVLLYGPFNGESNVIFPEHTQYLERDAGDLPSLSYQEILKDLMTHRQKCSGANSSEKSLYFLLLVNLIQLWLIKF